ncbi:DNA-binding Xre family transcriptional regulator [Anaerosolibacter carboniphilus]|uniref:DNA-binding Xre family transcriptional regulator n=1 Tax=Anaerosolibacter carboniphilus TaxID=1417629 RepID=A0A841KMB5_9FIRM|nr:helix-turn-helix transcriptional regulator [Anaerosolibacter carboniphilus]MBB6214944.1 DNA-binding Xre family transcriptional regulator [Anaerosolibacter carboniphilus]
MSISYKGLKIQLVKNDRQLQDLENDLGIAWATISKINKNEYLTLKTLEKIATYLNCDIGDLVSVVKEVKK